MKVKIASLLPREINNAFSFKEPYRGKQVFKWFSRGVLDFERMTDLPKDVRKELSLKAVFSSSIDTVKTDTDGTVKVKVALEDGLKIESVLLEDERGRKTACLSTQVGCGMGCKFCRTALMGLKRNLTVYEIVEQFYLLMERYGDISNIVFMGMGEPLDNMDNLKKAVEIFHSGDGLGMSLRRITISTSGLVKGIRELTYKGPHVRLALSLVTAREGLRKTLMPVTRANPLSEVKSALIEYQEATGKRITLEMVMLGGVNDGDDDIRALVKFIPPLKVVVNVIPWNPAKDIQFIPPNRKRVKYFKEALKKAGIPVTQRYTRGQGINGACGQLMVIEPSRKDIAKAVVIDKSQ